MALFGLPKLTRVKVSGTSMEPTYNDGDILLARWFDEQPHLKLLDAVVIERDAMPGVFFIKRIQKMHGDGIWVEGDNHEIAERINDSKTWGYLGKHEIRARVLVRLKRG